MFPLIEVLSSSLASESEGISYLSIVISSAVIALATMTTEVGLDVGIVWLPLIPKRRSLLLFASFPH